jgi:hypothetical protein
MLRVVCSDLQVAMIIVFIESSLSCCEPRVHRRTAGLADRRRQTVAFGGDQQKRSEVGILLSVATVRDRKISVSELRQLHKPSEVGMGVALGVRNGTASWLELA